MYGLFPSFISCFLVYVWLQALGFGFNPLKWFTCCTEKNEGAENVIKSEWEKLGKMKLGEYISLSCFIVLTILWVTRESPDETVMASGWADYFPIPSIMHDGMTVMFICVFLFILPRNESGLFAIFNCFRSEENKVDISKLSWSMNHTVFMTLHSNSIIESTKFLFLILKMQYNLI